MNVSSHSPPPTSSTLPLQQQLHQSPITVEEACERKNCSDLGFGRRQRGYRAHDDDSYIIPKSTIKVSTWRDMPAVTATLVSRDGSRNLLTLAILVLENGLFRVAISDFEEPLHERYVVGDVVLDHCKALPIHGTMLAIGDESVTISVAGQKHAIILHLKPFQIDLVTLNPEAVKVSINNASRLMIEDYGKTPLFQYDEIPGETFRNHVDPQIRGPESVGIDVSFPSAEHLSGIPERTTPLSLPETISRDGEVLSEPYRMYNLDVTYFELDKPVGLYGNVPLLYSRSSSSVTGLVWHNASETYLDVQTSSMNVSSKATHWFAESGIVDIFLLPGPEPSDVFKQYLWLTGSPLLPPLFSLGYHQCRYSYEDEADVRRVDAGLSSRHIPYDVMWLDIDHTDGKRYFTWDYKKFPDPVQLQEDLARNGRKTVTIIDPHVKTDELFPLHAHATKERLYVQQPDGSDYRGHCWPGESCYLNFLSPRVRSEWGNRFSKTLYPGITEHLHVWNDMNEPAVFGGPEGTMQKNILHDGVEHRHVHNLYGHSMARATYEGLLKNRPDQRPFVLTRSFFAGTQRYAAVWTGDNTPTWAHLRSSVPMLLSLQICGHAQSGADIGGFLGDPDGELMARWYQVGAFQPFFRGHSNKGTKRREPWLFGEKVTTCIRQAICARYEFLTYWYTLFASLLGGVGIANGGPPMRPVWWEFDGWDNDETMWMVGDSLLIAPVMEAGVTRHEVDLPDGRWYDVYGGQREVRKRADMNIDLERMVVFLRGGRVVPKMVSKVRSSVDVARGNYCLLVGLDEQGCAYGVGYFDDGSSFGYRRGDYCVMKWTYKDGVLGTERVGSGFVGEGVVTEVRICGFQNTPPKQVFVEDDGGVMEAEFTHSVETGVLQVKNIAVPIADGNWTIRIDA